MTSLAMSITLTLTMATGQGDGTVPIRAAFVRIIQQAEVPAADRGTLQAIAVRLGQTVDRGQELARLEDGESQLAVQVAELDVKIASRQAETNLPVTVASAHVAEAELEKQRAKMSQEIAEKKVRGDVAVQQATKTLERFRRNLSRAISAKADYPASVSESEMEKRQLEFDVGALELQSRKLEVEVADLKSKMEKLSADQFGAAVARLKQEVSVAEEKLAQASITKRLKERTLELAKLRLQKRAVVSPLKGEIAEILKHRGEWVEAGTPIFRVIRLDRLRIEGYVPAAQGVRRLIGSKVSISRGEGVQPLIGVVTYVSAEVDSVSNEVEIHAEFDNRSGRLWPGQSVEALVNPLQRVK